MRSRVLLCAQFCARCGESSVRERRRGAACSSKVVPNWHRDDSGDGTAEGARCTRQPVGLAPCRTARGCARSHPRPMLRGTARPDASVPWPSGPLAAALASRIIDMLALSRIPGNDARAQPCNRPEGSRSLEFLVDGMRSSCARLRATAWRSRESSASLSCDRCHCRCRGIATPIAPQRLCVTSCGHGWCWSEGRTTAARGVLAGRPLIHSASA